MSEKTSASQPKQNKAKPAQQSSPKATGPQADLSQVAGSEMLESLPEYGASRPLQQRALLSMQRTGGNQAATAAVQRLQAGGVIQRAPVPPASAPNPNVVTSVTYDGRTLSNNDDTVRQALEAVATEKGLKGAQAWADGFAGWVLDQELRQGATGASGGQATPMPSGDLAAQQAIVPVMRRQMGALKKDSEQFFKDFEGNANGALLKILQGSEERLRKEAERYGLMGSGLTLNPLEVQSTGPGNAETAGLAAAAGEAQTLRGEIDGLIIKRSKLFKPDDPFQLFVNKDEENALTTEINEKEKKYDDLLVKYPVLAGFKDPEKKAQLAQMSKGGVEAAGTVGPFLVARLKDIEMVRGATQDGRMKVWNLPTVVKGAKNQMGLSPGTLGNKLVDDRIQEMQSDELILNIAVAVITIGLGILASIPTAGAGGAAMVAGGASLASAGVSAYQAATALQEYQLAKAASGSDMDKAKAISQEDPSLFWLAIDIVGAIADIHGALKAFRVLGPQVRGILGTVENFEHLDESMKAFEESCKTAKMPSLYEKVVARVKNLLSKNKQTVDDLKKIAKERYAGLSEAERAKMLESGVSEEKFIEQMASNAQRDIVISGADGVRRTQLVTDLMSPNNPRIAAIIGGDTKAMDALLIEHGSWQQLMSQLSSGTPEMKAASQRLVQRRGEILKKVEDLFNAKPAGGASSEAVSDVDLIANGPQNAGEMMMKAEKFVEGEFGKGWSEALRMNFYTMAERLYMYAREMKGLPPHLRGEMLKDLSKQTDLYTVAKMMEYAHGDAAALKRAEEYAKTLGVDINNPKLKELLSTSKDASSRIKERDRLLLKADELMSKYNRLPPNASPQERMALAREISENQMRANFFTEEAYIGPGAARMVVTGIDVVGYEAKMAVTSQLSMVAHEVAKYGGRAELAMREYEIYKYINRFASAARKAGSKHPGLDFYENLSAFIYKTERSGASSHVHITDLPGKTTPAKGAPYLSENAPRVGKVEDEHLTRMYNDFNRFSHEVLSEIDVAVGNTPTAWTPFNIPRPAAGSPP